MAVDIKVAPDNKLELVKTYITDTNSNSDYFNVSELPDTFSGGKNAFLIAGTDKLLPNSEIKIQIRDANGKVCYIEYANGIPEYYEGNSKVVAVYVYPTDTAFGPSTITILGQLADAPPEWNGLYSVKWQKQININPALANTTRVRLYKRPQVTIKEILQPIYKITTGSKVASNVTQSFAAITVNQLETFAGDVARVKVYRTSAGDISDYELIQDIRVESKNLLTTYALSGSVVGNAGLFGPDSLTKVWNTGSLHAVLDSTWVNDGLQLTGSGTLKYTSSLNLLSSNTYELELDTFYTGSTATNLVAYISGTQNGAIPITTFSGSTPTKNFGTTTTAFTIPNDEPTASLYLSQSSGINQWHVGNISLNLSQDTAFSPNEISFITSMPTVLGNETFNFKFEFYDVNNNYVPVAVTQSALFNGGNNNIGGTLVFISSSVTELSMSVSGTIGVVTGSVSQSFYTSSVYSASLQSSSLYISSSISGTISSVSASLSSSVFIAKSASFAQVKSLADGNYSGVFIDGKTVYAPTIGGTQGYISELFTVGSTAAATINLDARTTTRKIWIGSGANGTYSSNDTPIYLDSSGQFSLGTGLTWSSNVLTVNGTINVTGGNAATQTYASSVATTAKNDAISTAAADATTKANEAYTNAYNNAKAVADAIANGTYDGGTLISKNSIVSPIIAGAYGYFSDTIVVGQNSGLTISGKNYAIYSGAGNWNNPDTGFYMNDGGFFSLKDKLSFNARNNILQIDGTVIARSGSIGTTTDGWIINSDNIASKNKQTVLNAKDGTIKLNDVYGVTKVSLNYDTTNATDPLNASQGAVSVTGIPAGTAYYAYGNLSGQGDNGYLQTPSGGSPFYSPTWNIDSNFTVPLTATYEFTLKFPVSSQLYATKTGGGGSPFIQVRLYVWRNSDGHNMNPRGYISIPDEGCNGQPVGTGVYGDNQFNTFYCSGIPLVAGEGYKFNIQYIIDNCDYDTQVTIGYYLPSINASYFAAVASSNMNQTGLNLGQDTDRYLFTKPGSLNFYDGYEAATSRQTIGEQGGSMLLLNSDLYGYFNDFQRLYINNASYPRSNRSSGGNFITSHFFGGYNRAFLNVRAYVLFEPDSSTNINTYAGTLYPFCLNVDKVNYVDTNTWDVTFVEPLFGNEGITGHNVMSAVLALDGAYGLSLVDVTNKTPYGCRIILNGEDSSGGRVALIVYK